MVINRFMKITDLWRLSKTFTDFKDLWKIFKDSVLFW